ncbi:hypothetical protein [Bacteroides sp. 519]|uniref:hypothetical protein n=1 Tax=Bacteroides sp. 519 TaxID=2302937 RepID=UPI0013D131D3|nr:hypothetical protein [Bacteroides sp. 519]NDV58888.1 hypothetical protein [Bacteroides sp. 519]
MARKIKKEFIEELKKGTLRDVLEYVVNDDTLNMELRGDRITVYYRGGALFTIKEDTYIFTGMDENYHKMIRISPPTISTLDDYIPKAKHAIDIYVKKTRNHLWEKDIQQQIAKENNYSPNSFDTDYFIIDTEYQDLGRFDIVALRWDSSKDAHKSSSKFLPIITVFEVKQGYSTCSGESGLYEHFNDFVSFTKNANKVEAFRMDMIEVFKQKRELGLIIEMEKYKEIKITDSKVDFIFLLANYKPKSIQVKNELERIKHGGFDVEPKFIYANSMGYGLFARNIVGGDEFIKRFICE